MSHAKKYQITNRMTHEVYNVEEPTEEDACEWLDGLDKAWAENPAPDVSAWLAGIEAHMDRLPEPQRARFVAAVNAILDVVEQGQNKDADREPDACTICDGTGRDPMSDDANWLTCCHCGGSGQEPATARFDPALRGGRW